MSAGKTMRPEDAAWWLGVVRATVFGLWLVKLTSGWLGTLAILPSSLLEPPFLLQAVPSAAWGLLLQPGILNGLQLATILFAALAAVGLRPYRPLAIVVAMLITFEQGLVRSYGYSNHPELFLVLATWILAFVPAADGFCRPARNAERPASEYLGAIAFIALVGCWTYAAAAAYRVAHHGFELFASDSMKHLIALNSFRFGSGASGAFVLAHPRFADAVQFLVPLTTAMELTAPLTLRSRRFLWVWLVFLFGFHVLTAISTTILFWESMLVLGAALVAFDRVTRGAA